MHVKRIVQLRVAAILIVVWTVSAAHAVYRGDEFEPRDYNVGNTFFINRAMIRQGTENWDRFERATNAFIGSAGSLSSTDLYLHQQLKVRHPLEGAFAFQADYLRDRDFDGVFHRFTLGLEYRLSPEWAVELVGEPLPDKEHADIGGAVSRRGDLVYWRFQWLFPDFVFDSKNPDNARMERSAPNFQFDARYQPAPQWDFRLHADFDPARRLVNPEESFQFRFRKYQMTLDARYRVSEAEELRASVEGEYSRQLREGLETNDPRDFQTDRDYLMGTLEYLRRLEQDTHFRAGGIYVRLDELNDFPNNLEESLLLDRHDNMLYAGRSWPLRDRIHFNSFVIVNVLSMRKIREDPDESASFNRFLGRAAGSIVFLGPQYNIEAGGAVSLDRTRFGGGFARVFVDF